MLDQEIATYQKLKPHLLEFHRGQFALIKGEDFVGTFPDHTEALSKGYKLFGLTPFLVRKVAIQDEVIFSAASIAT